MPKALYSQPFAADIAGNLATLSGQSCRRKPADLACPHPLDKRWTFYTEAFTTQPFEAGDKPIYTMGEALTLALNPNWQLDFGGNFSLNSVAPRTQLYAGLSQRFLTRSIAIGLCAPRAASLKNARARRY